MNEPDKNLVVMGRQTETLVNPTLGECVHLAKDPDINLPEREAKKFWAYWESVGWVMKDKRKMKSLRAAMMTWKFHWEERGGEVEINGHSRSGLSGIDKKILSDELNRLLEHMKKIRNSYAEHQDWRTVDAQNYKRFKKRADEIRSKLGVVV